MNLSKKSSLLIIFSLGFLLSSCSSSNIGSGGDDVCHEPIEPPLDEPIDETGDVYFFDSESTDGDGTKEKPYSNLSKINDISFKPGTKIFLKKNSVFKEKFSLKNLNGEKENPIIFTSYGDKGAKPKIVGKEALDKGIVYISNCSNILFQNIEIYSEIKEESAAKGILVELSNEESTEEVKTYHNITLKNLYIHDIYGFSDKENQGMAMKSKLTGGIHLWSSDGNAKIDGFNVLNSKIENVTNVGIATWYKVVGTRVSKISPYDDDFEKYAHTNVTISNNEISYIGKNAAFLRNIKGGKFDHNVVHDTTIICNAGNQIVTSYVDDIVVEYNEGYNNKASLRADGKVQDGAMLDSDLQTKNVIFQYNYSHNNSFGLYISCDGTSKNDKGASDNVILRYNVSINDYGNKGIIYANYYSGKIECYNNTIITDKATKNIIEINNDRTLSFYNNIVFSRSKDASFTLGNMTNFSVSNNIIHGISAIKNVDEMGIYLDVDLRPLKKTPDDVESLIGFGKIKDYATFTYDSVYDEKNCKNMNVNIPDILGNDYKLSFGAINKF
mgnify:FL=1